MEIVLSLFNEMKINFQSLQEEVQVILAFPRCIRKDIDFEAHEVHQDSESVQVTLYINFILI